ncbi:MAG TPA: UDP-N-acetylmuramoyl-L-alanyl-D-glutamate--2,6-diaminopimelate ligase, partial [Gemmatimonadetes bacterium]|nr:UDP-N-acetylmuramoyl-L-alanyl-D-glutamate--2,6-diaminopimelate ligase [Gemmatimonadota bacterium]
MSEVTCALHAVLDVLRTAGLLTEVRGSEDVVVRGVSQDSRTTVKDDLFLAWKGTQDDAHDFVPSAIGRGASAVVVERSLQVDVPQLVVRDGRQAAALAADVVLGSPSARMAVVGVTGTNGKTTTSLLVRHLVAPEKRTAVIGTLGLTLQDGVRAANEDLTTPGPVQLTEWMRDLSAKSYETVVIEASSHAIEQHRLYGISFDVAVFTNLSQDHLDYHGDMEAYRAAKL